MPTTRMSLDSFTTPRLLAERLTPDHLPTVRRMDGDQRYMARLGGTRDMAATAAYMERAVLRHLEVEGVDEVEVGYGFYPEFWGRGLAPEVR